MNNRNLRITLGVVALRKKTVLDSEKIKTKKSHATVPFKDWSRTEALLLYVKVYILYMI